jgi:hypothetical protein
MIKFMRRAIAVCFLLAASVSAYAAPLDLPRFEYAFDAVWFADMLTTLDIKEHANLQETNKMLGPHPSDAKVIGYFTAGAAVHALITHELQEHGAPRWITNGWELVTIGSEAATVRSNLALGLRFKF